MGITGLYSELGPGQRISLTKLSSDHLSRTGRFLRLGIDISIWSFQIQASKGGANPALRTLYYRLVKLLSYPIDPIFVFDGPNKPTFKRNKKVGGKVVSSNIASAQKMLIELFGWAVHVAPGEAEAELASLQRAGVIDMVLSEDVDTLMFGCGIVLRNWSGEGKNGKNVSPTHVTMYELEKIEREKGLDREGMILIALMSGGDYIPEGVPRCGIKISTAAAKAGFGRSLCSIDGERQEEDLRLWRGRLERELRTNESRYFGRRNLVIDIPSTFPDRQILGYYVRPVVTDEAEMRRLRNEIKWRAEIDILALREFVRDQFQWRGKGGAIKLIRTLAPSLLVSKILETGNEEMLNKLLEKIFNRRLHSSTDGISELRVSFVPLEVVPLDLSIELENDILEDDHEDGEDSGSDAEKGVKKSPKEWNPTANTRIWIAENFLRLALPARVEEWEATLNNTKKAAPRPKATAASKVKVKGGMKYGAMDKFVKVSKPSYNSQASKLAPERARTPVFTRAHSLPSSPIPSPASLAKAPPRAAKPTAASMARSNPPQRPIGKAKSHALMRGTAQARTPSGERKKENTNPWSMARRETYTTPGNPTSSQVLPSPCYKRRNSKEIQLPGSPSGFQGIRNQIILGSSPESPSSAMIGSLEPSSPNLSSAIANKPLSLSFDLDISPSFTDHNGETKHYQRISTRPHDRKHSRPTSHSPLVGFDAIEISSPPLAIGIESSHRPGTPSPRASPVPRTPSKNIRPESNEPPSKKHKSPRNRSDIIGRVSSQRSASPSPSPNASGRGASSGSSGRSEKLLGGGFLLPEEDDFPHELFVYGPSRKSFEGFGYRNNGDELPLPTVDLDDPTSPERANVSRISDLNSSPPVIPRTHNMQPRPRSGPDIELMLPSSPSPAPIPDAFSYSHTPLYSRNYSSPECELSSSQSLTPSEFSLSPSPDRESQAPYVHPFVNSNITSTRGNFSPRKHKKKVLQDISFIKKEKATRYREEDEPGCVCSGSSRESSLSKDQEYNYAKREKERFEQWFEQCKDHDNDHEVKLGKLDSQDEEEADDHPTKAPSRLTQAKLNLKSSKPIRRASPAGGPSTGRPSKTNKGRDVHRISNLEIPTPSQIVTPPLPSLLSPPSGPGPGLAAAPASPSTKEYVSHTLPLKLAGSLKLKDKKKRVALRESFLGHWRDLDYSPPVNEKVKVWKDVDVLDLSQD